MIDRNRLRIFMLAYYYDQFYDKTLSLDSWNLEPDEIQKAEVFLLDEMLVEGDIHYIDDGTPVTTIVRINSRGISKIEDIIMRRYQYEHPISTTTSTPSQKDQIKEFFSICITKASPFVCDVALKAGKELMNSL